MNCRDSCVSRRRFLQGVAAAAPVIVSPAVLGAGKTPPSERVTVGIIGIGKMAGESHLPSLLGLADVQVVAVCEVDTTRRLHGKQVVEKHYSKQRPYKGCAAYNDFRDLLARKDVDAVAVIVPDHWHAPITDMACRAGKDVYCEKPLTLTIREARLSIDAVRKYGRVFQTGSQQRSNVFGQFREAAEIIRSGRLGQIKTVTVGVGGPSKWCDLPAEPMEPGLDWNLWLGAAPERPYNSILSPRKVHTHFPAWRSYREYAGGSHADMGAHYYDIVQWALGMDHSGPVEIIPPADPASGKGCKYLYANGVEMTHGGPDGCFFTGTRGTLYITRGKLVSEPAGIVKEPLGKNDVHLFRSPGHHRNWIDCIRSRQKPIADVEIGARSVTIVHLGNLAYWHGRRLRWDPQAWRFVGDDEANRWLDCPRRDPWQLPSI